MRVAFLTAIVVGLVMGVAVAGFRVVMRDDPSSPAATTTGTAGAHTPTAPAGSALSTVQSFARAWSAGDIDGLYLLLGPEAQRRYPLADFKSEYHDFGYELTASGITATAESVSGNQGHLKVAVDTGYFGRIEYTTTLNLEQTTGKWLVDWDRSAIHPEMVQGRAFKSTIERPKRGSILDRNGTVLAATMDIRTLALNRSLIKDRDATKAKLVAFGYTAAQVDAAYASTLAQNQRVPLGAIPDARLIEVNDLVNSTPGTLLYFESQRVHPLGASAAHVVGYTRELTAEELVKRQGEGLRPGDRVGATGLEAGLDSLLAGTPGIELRLEEFDGTVVRTVKSQPLVQGQNVTTTLDAGVLQTTQARLGTRAGAAVVIDPRSNGILALNSSPSFDPDAFERNDAATLEALTKDPKSPLTNRATGGLYSAGSTFKLITGSAGLVYGGYKVTDTIYCGATWNGIDPPRANWEGAQGNLTIAGGLMRSCNPVFYEIGLHLYNNTDGALSKMARQYGFGAETGVQYLGEEAGLVPDAQWKKANRGEPWYPGDEVNLAIGQGDLLITPLQLANAYSTFINRQLRNPIIVSGQAAKPAGDKLPLDDAQWNLLLSGLKAVTGPNGTANTAFANLGYTDFGGKSGTAEDAGAQQHVLFVAFSPANAPRAVAAVVLDDGESGSLEAGPIARDLVLAAIK
jgi:penicillin-binding protein 2